MTTTVKLLSTYDNFPPYTILDLPDDIAAKLLAGGIGATTDLTGGERRYKTTTSVSATPRQDPPANTTVGPGERKEFTVPPGYRLQVSGSATVETLNDKGVWEKSGNGPFGTQRQVRVASNSGTVNVTARDNPPLPKVGSSIMWLGDSITALLGVLPNVPKHRAIRPLEFSLPNINSAGAFVSIKQAGPDCVTGIGTLRYYAATDSMSWQAFGDTEGARVPVPTVGFYALESGTAGNTMYIAAIGRFKPTTDKSDTLNVTGRPEHRSNVNSAGIMGWTNALLGGAFSDITCYAVSGAKTLEWVAGMSQFEGKYSDITHIMLSTNDVFTLVDVGMAISNLETIIQSRQAIGSTVVVGCLLPAGTRNAAATQAAVEYNRQVRAMALRLNFDAWDAWEYVGAAGGTGNYEANMSQDQLHPTSLGAYRIAKNKIVPIMQKYVQPAARLFAGALFDATNNPYGNLLANGQLKGTAGTANATGISGQAPDNWTVIREGSATPALTVVSTAPDSAGSTSRTDGRLGKYWTLAINNSTGAQGEAARALASTTTGFAAGDYVVLEGEFQISGTGIQAVEAMIITSGGTQRASFAVRGDYASAGSAFDLSGDTVPIQFRSVPLLLETGTTSLQVSLYVYMKAGGVATLNVSQNINLHRVPAPV